MALPRARKYAARDDAAFRGGTILDCRYADAPGLAYSEGLFLHSMQRRRLSCEDGRGFGTDRSSVPGVYGVQPAARAASNGDMRSEISRRSLPEKAEHGAKVLRPLGGQRQSAGGSRVQCSLAGSVRGSPHTRPNIPWQRKEGLWQLPSLYSLKLAFCESSLRER